MKTAAVILMLAVAMIALTGGAGAGDSGPATRIAPHDGLRLSPLIRAF